MNSYFTVQAESEAILVEKSSKFIAYCSSISSKEEAELYLQKIKTIHPKARHWCYAYRVGLDKNNYRTHDDGEPSGTAGKPILAQIDSMSLTNTMIIVVRYFGGILLGTGGLIKAYKSASSNVIKQSKIVEVEIQLSYLIKTNQEQIYQILKLIKNLQVQYQDLLIEQECSVFIHISKNSEFSFFKKLKTLIENEEPKAHEDVYQIRHCKIELVNA